MVDLNSKDIKDKLKLNSHEVIEEAKPVAIKYICEHCNNGEMIAVTNEVLIVPLEKSGPPMVKHRCNKCGGELMLPKTYPYIEWLTKDKYPEVFE